MPIFRNTAAPAKAEEPTSSAPPMFTSGTGKNTMAALQEKNKDKIKAMEEEIERKKAEREEFLKKREEIKAAKERGEEVKEEAPAEDKPKAKP